MDLACGFGQSVVSALVSVGKDAGFGESEAYVRRKARRFKHPLKSVVMDALSCRAMDIVCKIVMRFAQPDFRKKR